MLKLLLKKQMLEIFRSYYFDAKKNKARSPAATTAYLIGFILLMAGVLGGIFAFLSAELCAPMASAEMDWLYFALMGLLAVLLGTFGSVFNTYSGLYLAKDNDLLLSMPIPVSDIMVSRLCSVYLLGLMYSGVVIIPAVIVYWVVWETSVATVVGGLLLTLIISVFVMTLSCALGWVVAKISLKLKHKSFITVIVSLVCIGAYYLFYFKAQSLIQDLLSNLYVYGADIKASAYPIYLFGNVGTGDAVASVTVLLVVAALFGIMWFLLSRSFLKVATSSGKVARTAYRETAVRQKSVFGALLGREFRHFTSSPNYMLNCGMGIILMPIYAVAISWKGGSFLATLDVLFEGRAGCIALLLSVVLCGIAGMNNMIAPSVSLEGKSLWLVQSLPVTSWQVLRSKLSMQLILTGIPVLICILCTAVVWSFAPTELMLILLHAATYVMLMAFWGLFLGIKLPNLTWTSEITPIKQSAGVAFALLGGFGYAVVLFAGFMLLPEQGLGYAGYIGCFIGANVVLGVLLYLWLRKKGCERFAAL